MHRHIPKCLMFLLLFASNWSSLTAQQFLSPEECSKNIAVKIDGVWTVHPGCPSRTWPDHACRYVEYMKKWGIDPQDPSLRKVKFSLLGWETDRDEVNGYPLVVTHPESYDSLQSKICSSYKKYQCANLTNLLYTNDNEIVDKYFRNELPNSVPVLAKKSGETGDPNIGRNFEYLVQENKNILTFLLNISEASKVTARGIRTRADLLKADENLAKEFKSVRQKSLDLESKEFAFIKLMDSVIQSIGTNAIVALGGTAGFDCDFSAEFSTEKHNNMVKELTESFNKMRSELNVRKLERSNFARLTYLRAKYQGYSEYSKKTGETISALEASLQRDFWLSRTMLNYGDWWASNTINGIAGGLHTQYYFHSEPLRLMKSQRAYAVEVKRAIQVHPSYEEITGKEALKAIDENIATLDRNIEFIEKRGWRGLLETQRASAKRRAELLPNNALCQAGYIAFENSAKDVFDVESFDRHSIQYMNSVLACKK